MHRFPRLPSVTTSTPYPVRRKPWPNPTRSILVQLTSWEGQVSETVCTISVSSVACAASPLASITVTWNQTSIPLSSFFDDFFRFLSLLAGSFPFSSWEKVRRMPIRCSFLWAGVIHQRSHWKSLLRGPKWGPIFYTSHKLKAKKLASEMEY